MNGTDTRFQQTKRGYELNSSLNTGNWLETHGVNRYRDWDELKYSIRSVDRYASSFYHKVSVLVNTVFDEEKLVTQAPLWANEKLEVLSQEEFFEGRARRCLPTFDSLTIESQLHNTPSSTDRVCTFA